MLAIALNIDVESDRTVETIVPARVSVLEIFLVRISYTCLRP